MSPAAQQLIAALEAHALRLVDDLATGGANISELSKPIADLRGGLAEIETAFEEFLAWEAKVAAAKSPPAG